MNMAFGYDFGKFDIVAFLAFDFVSQGATGPEVRGSGKPMLVTVTNELTDFGRQNDHFFIIIMEFPYLDTGLSRAAKIISPGIRIPPDQEVDLYLLSKIKGKSS